MVGKVKGEDITYYEMNEKLQLSAKGTPIKGLYMTFVDVTNHLSNGYGFLFVLGRVY